MSARKAEIDSLISKLQESATRRFAEHNESYMAGVLESLLTTSMMGMTEWQYETTSEVITNLTNIPNDDDDDDDLSIFRMAIKA